ncbi:metal-dependent transcriptional regulator [Rhizosphaericola mali]|uniref:Transcriptional regulator MntR n=1 Tax=Rhizosphaericola mali TaxID=2545455 RepID=A0A5P2FZ16_9BACT|nr:metal-dependent transcriptional regulator [Rhizosphaericola mali]QES88177.1 metal-dependent transcriptional regulator [Rhizosphaericola mali]
MNKLTHTEENYLKVIHSLEIETSGKIQNLAIADKLEINPATVTEMLKKLQEKKLIDYTRIDGASLTKNGNLIALSIIRKHRLWETFLEERLGFNWDEVHDIAEQLEHIQSDKLIDRLSDFLGNPKFDPHGDPIPDANGKVPETSYVALSKKDKVGVYQLNAVANESKAFLQYLDKIQLNINDKIEVKEINDFDKSMIVTLNDGKMTMFSNEVAKNLFVTPFE